MKRKFLAAAVLGVMVSVTPAGAYAASTETSPLPVNSESETTVQSEAEETTPEPTETPEVTPSETPAPTEAPITTPTEISSEISTLDSAVSSLKEGWNSVEQDGKKLFQYGVLDENNKVVAATGPIEIDGVGYVFDENGYMLTGEVELTDKDGKTGTYYLNTEGEDPAKDGLGSMQQGICEGKVFAPELKRNELVTLEFNDGSVDDYYADENGYAIWSKTQKVGDKTYLFGEEGARIKEPGFQVVTDGNGEAHTYYLNEDGTVSLGNHNAYQQGDRTVSWLTVGSNWYLVDAETGELLSGWQKVDTAIYYMKPASFDANGNLKDGSFEMETGNQKNKSGWAQIDGKWYSFRSWGGVRTGWFNYDGNKYYLHEDGHMEDNALNVNGTMYLFKSWGGMRVNDVGSYNGNYYYVGADGAVSTTTGWKKIKTSTQTIWYWATADGGKLLTNSWLDYNGNSYYLKADGKMAFNEWLDNTYYFRSWGAVYKNAWAKVNNVWYYFDGNGKKYTSGWLTYKGNEYYLKSDGTMLANEWLDGKYYFKSWGGMYKNEWGKSGNTWYWFNADGTKRTQKGWFLYDKNYYYLDKDGKMLTGWVYHDGNYYYMKSWGGMAHDQWILHDKNWYYFKSWGGMYHDQWLTLNGSQYYFRSWGGRYQNCTATINGKQYKFDASGRRITEGWEYIGKYRRYRKADGSLMEDVTSIFNPSSKYITVDRTRGRVTIYGYNSATGAYDTPIKSMICSVGNPISYTAAGTYKIGWQLKKKQMKGEDYVCWAPYVSQIYGAVYFHGVASSTADLNNISAVDFNSLGSPMSHGCVRLAAIDAKWIYYNVSSGTTVRIGDNLDYPLTNPTRYTWTGGAFGSDPTYS
ncbi:MAG: L,D-transpeptidase family protein [Blautia sp.]|nr:L,D-transpeptidase family protein [Blautia sp.]